MRRRRRIVYRPTVYGTFDHIPLGISCTRQRCSYNRLYRHVGAKRERCVISSRLKLYILTRSCRGRVFAQTIAACSLLNYARFCAFFLFFLFFLFLRLIEPRPRGRQSYNSRAIFFLTCSMQINIAQGNCAGEFISRVISAAGTFIMRDSNASKNDAYPGSADSHGVDDDSRD